MNITANAKINLTLDITGVREDGFHTLRSVMAPISLSDELSLEKSDVLAFDCNLKSLCTEDNLCVKAAKAFLERAEITSGVKISLEKRIPFPAGLGGGSADCAAVLRGMNELFGNPLSESELFSLAEKLGSDVPLCLLGKTALCEGRGEILTPVEGLPKLNVVIAIGEARLSTPAVYREYDKANLPMRDDTDAFYKALEEKNVSSLVKSFGNAFEPVADVLASETKEIREALLSLGALCAHLSGSGPSVYGIFADENSAKTAVSELKTKGYSAYSCVTL